MKPTRTLASAGIACAPAMSPLVLADDDSDCDEDEVPFDVAQVFFELNNTDGDLGIHALIDGPDGEEFVTVFSVVLPPDVTSMTVPDEFLSQTDEFKFEVLAREESWNQTAVESCFLLDDGD